MYASIGAKSKVAMTSDLDFHRRVLVVLYRKYLDADRAWRLAQGEALSWFPLEARPAGSLMGNPGSHLRRLYERRDRALSQFMVVYGEIDQARRRAVRQVHILALPPS
jgi:hypothetical protein